MSQPQNSKSPESLNLEADILQLELKIMEMAKRPVTSKWQLPAARIRLRAMRRNLELIGGKNESKS